MCHEEPLGTGQCIKYYSSGPLVLRRLLCINRVFVLHVSHDKLLSEIHDVMKNVKNEDVSLRIIK